MIFLLKSGNFNAVFANKSFILLLKKICKSLGGFIPIRFVETDGKELNGDKG
jgi:hypothetical protein